MRVQERLATRGSGVSTSTDARRPPPVTITIGLDVGGTKILGVVCDAGGVVLDEARKDSAYERVQLFDAMAEVVRGFADWEAVALGVGIAGMVTLDGRLRYGPNLPGVEEIDVRAEMVDRVGQRPVVENDANVAAYGEARFGAARGHDHVLMVTLGTGIGGGIVVGGEIVRGANGFAGEIGHWTVQRGGPRCACGADGHWEAIASGSALGRMAREAVATGRLVLDGAIDGHRVADAARAGDEAARGVVTEYAQNVAIGLAGLATILDPEVIVIAGGVVEMGEVLFAPLRAAFHEHLEGREHRPAIALVPATLGERAGAIGAAALAAASVRT